MSAQPGGGESSSSSEAQTAYNDLKRLIPSLAAELELLRTSLREHSLWLLRYGHGQGAPPAAAAPTEAGTAPPPATSETGQPSSTTTTAGRNDASAATARSYAEPVSRSRSAAASGGPQRTESSSSSSSSSSPPPAPAPTGPPPAFSESEPPAYSASDVPPYTGGFSTVSASTREEVQARRDQLTEWLREGEDVLREYSARYAQLAEGLGLPHEDLLGTWHEAHPDNALPGYQQIERNEELMVGGVGEVPPPYLGGRPPRTNAALSRGDGGAAVASSSKGAASSGR